MVRVGSAGAGQNKFNHLAGVYASIKHIRLTSDGMLLSQTRFANAYLAFEALNHSNSDNNLVNYYIQSSTVDFCSLAFNQFSKEHNIAPSYFIHDSMTFQCLKNDLSNILQIKSILESYSNIDIPVEFNVLYK